jgi:hypothetical protein
MAIYQRGLAGMGSAEHDKICNVLLGPDFGGCYFFETGGIK